MGITLRQNESGEFLKGTSSGQVPVWDEATEEWEASSGVANLCTSVLAYTGGSYANVAGINLALASGLPEVCFPAGIYEVDAPIIQNTPGQILTFEPGAILRMSANGLGQLQINGLSASVEGRLEVRFDEASAVAYVAVDLHGVNSWCERVTFTVNDDVTNCKLIRLSGQSSSVGPIIFAGVGSFKIGCEFANQDGSRVAFVEAGKLLWRMVDDGIHTRNYDSLLRMRAIRSGCTGLTINHNGRQVFATAIVHDAGTTNWLRNPQIEFSSASPVGILQEDDAEFLDIFGGQLVGNFTAGSVGIRCGDGSKLVGTPAVGQLKCYGTKITNWDVGVLITASADSPGFVCCTIANNKSAMIRIDSQRGADVWPVSGLSIYDTYSEERAFPGAPFLHLVSGQLLGGAINGGEIGYTGTAILVEAGFGINTIQVDGGRWPAAAVGDAISTPNANSNFYFTRIAQSGSNLIGKGAFADRAMSSFDPTLVGLVVGTKDTGTALNRFTNIFTDIYTVNFGNILAGGFQQLTFGYAGMPTVATGTMLAAMDSAFNAKLAAGAIISFTQGPANQFSATVYNPTLATINAISGGVRIEVHKFG